ncbi:MAG: DEAD/DEAH box helicase family protein [Gemmataceae bacterium]
MLVTLPPVYRFRLKDGANTVLQLGAPEESVESQLTTVLRGRTKAYTLAPTSGGLLVHLLPPAVDHPNGATHVLRLRSAGWAPSDSWELSGARWERHPGLLRPLGSLADYEAHAASARDSWHGAFSYRQEDVERGVEGLRPPQIGALHAIQAHWAVTTEPARVVLPTGVGKTETMLSALVAERCHRLLVVVPSDVLRAQLAGKFITLGLLKTPQFRVVADGAHYPVVGVLSRRPKDVGELEAVFRKCNVVVNTIALAAGCQGHLVEKMTELCQYLFIDEARARRASRTRGAKRDWRSPPSGRSGPAARISVCRCPPHCPRSCRRRSAPADVRISGTGP